MLLIETMRQRSYRLPRKQKAAARNFIVTAAFALDGPFAGGQVNQEVTTARAFDEHLATFPSEWPDVSHSNRAAASQD